MSLARASTPPYSARASALPVPLPSEAERVGSGGAIALSQHQPLWELTNRPGQEMV
jgi:hypothetical protein